MIWQVSWRNVWRNKLRSGVVVAAISLGMFAGIFSMAFMRGMANQRMDSAIKTQVSHIQIHTPAFTEVSDIENFISDSRQKVSEIDTMQYVQAASARLVINAIINSAEKGTGVKLYGVNPENESKVTNIKDKLVEGNYLETLKRGKPILIGKKLAETLDVKTGSKIVAGMVGSDGHPVYYQFRIGGIFETVNTTWDESNAFVRMDDLREITGLPAGAAHEIAIYLDDSEHSGIVAERLKNRFGNLDIKEWLEIMPELSYLTEQMDLYMYIFILIILLALGFGIVNTMLMVVLERVKEIGMLMAVGMNKKRIFSMIMLETVFLSLTGGIIGIILGSVVSYIFETRGINLSALYGKGLSAFGYDSIVYTTLQTQMIIITTILVILTGMIASVFPAIKALKLNPASAIRTDI